jgi:hypothetical protein
VKRRVSIEEYLHKLERFCGSDYGMLVREQFKDNEGKSELGMLVSPSSEELDEFKKAVGAMSAEQRQAIDHLNDEDVLKIAAAAGVDPANLAIFINGYILHCRSS